MSPLLAVEVSGGVDEVTGRMGMHGERLVLRLAGLPSGPAAHVAPHTKVPRMPLGVVWVVVGICKVVEVGICAGKVALGTLKGGVGKVGGGYGASGGALAETSV